MSSTKKYSDYPYGTFFHNTKRDIVFTIIKRGKGVRLTNLGEVMNQTDDTLNTFIKPVGYVPRKFFFDS